MTLIESSWTVPNCTLIRATLDAFDEVKRIHRAAMFPSVSVAVGWDDQTQADRLRRHWHPSTFFLRSGDETVGLICLFVAEGVLQLEHLYIPPEHQNRGFGSTVLRQCREIADREGIPTRLTCLKKSPARSFYERNGFQKVGEDPWQDHMIRPVPRLAARTTG